MFALLLYLMLSIIFKLPYCCFLLSVFQCKFSLCFFFSCDFYSISAQSCFFTTCFKLYFSVNILPSQVLSQLGLTDYLVKISLCLQDVGIYLFFLVSKVNCRYSISLYTLDHLRENIGGQARQSLTCYLSSSS